MLDLYGMLIHYHKYILFGVILFGFLDCTLVHLAKKRNPSLKNIYFDWHRRYGFFKLTVFKVILILLLSYFLLIPLGKRDAGFVEAMAIIYCVVIITLLVDFVRASKKRIKS